MTDKARKAKEARLEAKIISAGLALADAQDAYEAAQAALRMHYAVDGPEPTMWKRGPFHTLGI